MCTIFERITFCFVSKSLIYTIIVSGVIVCGHGQPHIWSETAHRPSSTILKLAELDVLELGHHI